jgi:tetratricopeptide (TPR) repeat protein
MKPSASRRRLFINEVLAKKEGLCEELTGVYLAVAERLGLPIHAVSAPRHVFIRWDDGSTKINFDPTWNMSLNDEEYMRAFNIHPDAARNGCYLRSMSSREFLSIELNNNLNFFMKRKAPPESLLGLSDALLKDNPLLAEAYLTNAAIMLEAGRPRDALGLSREVVRVDPNYIPGYHIGATALAQMGDYPDSVKMAANGVMVAEETVKTLQKRGHPINNDLLVSVAGLHDVMGFSLVKIHEIEERKGNQENADTALRMAVGFYRSGINMLAGVEGTKDLTDGLKKNLGALGQSQ